MIVFLDLDGTLKTSHTALLDENSPNVISAQTYRSVFYFQKRPYCEELCKFCHKNFTLIISTASRLHYAKKMVENLNIDQYVEKIIDVEQFRNRIRLKEDYVIVDDDDELLDIKNSKFYGSNCLGAWKVDTFEAGNEKDDTLLEVIEELKQFV